MTLSVRESLEAAQTQLAGDAPQAEAPAAAPVEAAQAPEASAPTTETAPAPEAAQTGAERDEHGRFKAKTEQAPAAEGASVATPAAEQPIDTAATAQPEPQTPETIRVPHALPAPLKAKFAELPPEWREAYVKQEEAIKTFKDEQAPKAARLNRFDEILGPHLDKWRFAGLDEFSGIQALISAQNILERNPVEGLAHIARSYGVNLQALAQQAVAQQAGSHEAAQFAPHAPDLNAALQPLAQQVQTLQQQLAAQSQASEAAQLAEARSAVDQFRNDPANLYFDNVKDDVARRLESGAAKTLAEAYEQATWANPEIRSLLLKAQTAPAAPAVDPAKKAKEDAERKKAEAASKAAGSVTGAPTPGATAPKGPPGSIRDSLLAAAQETGFRV